MRKRQRRQICTFNLKDNCAPRPGIPAFLHLLPVHSTPRRQSGVNMCTARSVKFPCTIFSWSDLFAGFVHCLTPSETRRNEDICTHTSSSAEGFDRLGRTHRLGRCRGKARRAQPVIGICHILSKLAITVGRQFEPERWRLCAMAWDGRTVVAAANREPPPILYYISALGIAESPFTRTVSGQSSPRSPADAHRSVQS